MKPKVLVIDDDEEIGIQMRWALAQDFEVLLATDRRQALEVFRQERPAVVTLDLGLPPQPRGVEEGLQTLHGILQEDAKAKVIVVSGREERKHARVAVGEGAYDFFNKPVDIDELRVLLRRALYVYELEREQQDALQQHEPQACFEGMVGESPQMQKIFETVRQVAAVDVPVLIQGESGTGKELVARAIHRQSARCDGPFVTINCGAIPENLLESELFGHEKGAFTGAHAQRKGRIENVQGGTLFLDEIGELTLPLQVKLLRFLQEHQIERVGGQRPINVDVRVLAATNVDLERAVAEGHFREDLYYRLGVMTIVLPPLRERSNDIVVLSHMLLKRYTTEMAKKVERFDRQAILAMQMYPWPGNVRELENRVKRAVIVVQGPRLTTADLGLSETEAPVVHRTLKEARGAFEKELILEALTRNKGHISRTATELGVSRPTLHGLIAKYAIER